MPQLNLLALLPEIILASAATCVLLSDIERPEQRRGWMAFCLLALLAAGYFVVPSFSQGSHAMGMVMVDAYTGFFKLALLFAVILVLFMTYEDSGIAVKDWGSLVGLLLLSAVGLMLLVSASDLLLVLIAIELMGITSFIMVGMQQKSRASKEAALKFFLIGAFSSGLMLYGMSWIYGLLGSTRLEVFWSARHTLAGTQWAAFLLANIFMLVGFGFKLAMVPFHMWVPDAYEGAPTSITAFLSVAPKAASIAFLMKLIPDPSAYGLNTVLALLAALTMTLGNFAALRQTNVKRLLAYSSIAQMGYILVGYVAAGRLGMASVMVYVAAYVFMNLGAFACVIAVVNETRSEEIDSFAGLGQRSFFLAMALVIFLLSLTGIPPLIGFIGKFSVFAAAVSTAVEYGQTWLFYLVGIAVLNSVVSLAYYLRLAHVMFFKAPTHTHPMVLPRFLGLSLALTCGVTLVFGLMPYVLLSFAQASAAWGGMP